MGELLRAAETFADRLTAIGWSAVALAVLFHLAKIFARTRSWRNILAAAYPESTVRWRSVLGAYVAGVGINAVLPARGGDVLKLYLVKHRIEGATYPTLAATLLVETLFDILVASLLLVWALQQGVLPGLDVIPRLPEVDWLWLLQHPRAAVTVAGVTVALAAVGAIRASRRVAAFSRRIRQGFSILREPRRYLRQVVAWQAVDWACRLATMHLLLQAFGVPDDLHSTLLVQVTQSLSTMLPLTPGGIGTEQALLVYVFSGTAPAAAVLAFSVGMKAILMAVNVLLGFAAIGLMLKTFRWRGAVERDRERPTAASRGG